MSAAALRLDVRRVGRRAVVSPVGDIDVATAGTLRSELLRQIDGDLDALILDLNGVGFMDSSGLSVVITALNRTSARGISLVVVCPSGKIRRVFEITGVAARVALTDDLDVALSASNG